jgi:hypothetical protein
MRAAECAGCETVCIRFFFNFTIYLQSVYIHLNTISKLCVEKRGSVEECSVAPHRDKRVKTLCGCREKKFVSGGHTDWGMRVAISRGATK